MTASPSIPGKFSDLPARALSVLIAAPLVLLAVWTGGLYYNALIGLIMLVGMFEWLRLQQKNPSIVCELVSYAGLVIVWWLATLQFYGFACLIIVAIAGFAHSLYERAKLENAAWITFGLPYLGGATVALLALAHASEGEQIYARALVLFLLFAVWAADIGAYALGRIIGGPKLAPIISPSKTWAGLFGALAGAGAVGYSFALTGHPPEPSLLKSIILGIFLGLAAQMGDMLESYAKRRAGVKDSGHILPGHGGMLDRIDGLILAAVCLALWHFAADGWSAI